MHNLNTHAYVLPHLNRFVRRTIIQPSNNDHPLESYSSGSDLNSNPLINLSSPIHSQPNSPITPTDPSCPSQSEFSKALDLPQQRADNQNPSFLNDQYQQGCRCHWSDTRPAGQQDALICDSAPHFYHHSKTGAVIRGSLKSSYQPSSAYAAISAPLTKALRPDQDYLPTSAKPVVWEGHIANKPDSIHSDFNPIPILISISHSLNPQPSAPRTADKTTQLSHPHPIPSIVSPVKLAQPVPPTAAHPPNSHPISTEVDPVQHDQPVLLKDDSSVSVIPSVLSESKPAPPHTSNPARAPVNREAIGSPVTSQDSGTSSRTSNNTPALTTNDSHGASVTTPTHDASTFSTTPAPILPAQTSNESIANRQTAYTSMSANGANHTGLPTSQTSNNTFSNYVGENNLAPSPHNSSNTELAKALGGTFGGIIGLSLLLIAGVLYSRRKSTRPRGESFADVSRSRPSSLAGPPMMTQTTSGITINTSYGNVQTASVVPMGDSLMLPVDPVTRYSSNGTGLLNKLQGTTAALQQAGLIAPTSSMGHNQNASEPDATQDPFGDAHETPPTTGAASINNSFASEQSETHHTDEGSASGETTAETVRFGAPPRGSQRVSGGDEAWWGSAT